MAQAVRQPTDTDEVNASFMAALERITSVPARPNLVDIVEDSLWKGDGAEHWNINAGSACDDED